MSIFKQKHLKIPMNIASHITKHIYCLTLSTDLLPSIIKMPRFYISTPLTPGLVPLPAQVVHHIAVLRLQAGDAVTVFDGTGGQWQATLQAQGKQWWARIDTHTPQDRGNTHAVTLVQALTSTEKMDWIVQKCTELGVARILPFAAARSTVKLEGERATKRVAHLQAVAIAACEQCGLNRVPQVAPVQTLAQCIAQLKDEQAQLISLALQNAQPLRSVLAPVPPRQAAIVIGPEGDFTPAELAQLDAAGSMRISLGPRVLRTETAGLAALAMLQAVWGL
jgi:16S rRNA (uracil1498-N3)-methyltransferase